MIHVAAWGAAWVERACREALRCLEDNLLSLEGPTWVIVSTDRGHGPAFGHLGTWLREGLTIEVKIVRQDVEDRDLLARCEAEALDLALGLGADLFTLCADHVFPLHHLKVVKTLLDHHRAVVGTSIRCRRDLFRDQVRLVGANLQAEIFHAIVMQTVHPWMFRYQVDEPPRTAPANVHQLLYPVPGGFDVRQGQAALLGLRCEGLGRDVLEGPPRSECQLLADLVDDPAAELCFVRDPRDGVALVGLDDDEGFTSFGEFPATEDELARTGRIFERHERDARLWAWSASHRVPYRFAA